MLCRFQRPSVVFIEDADLSAKAWHLLAEWYWNYEHSSDRKSRLFAFKVKVWKQVGCSDEALLLWRLTASIPSLNHTCFQVLRPLCKCFYIYEHLLLTDTINRAPSYLRHFSPSSRGLHIFPSWLEVAAWLKPNKNNGTAGDLWTCFRVKQNMTSLLKNTSTVLILGLRVSSVSVLVRALFNHSTLTIILWEVVNQMRVHNLLLQQVLLVEEQNDWGVLEPGVCDYCPKQSFTLLHPVLHRVYVNGRGQKDRNKERKQRDS